MSPYLLQLELCFVATASYCYFVSSSDAKAMAGWFKLTGSR